MREKRVVYLQNLNIDLQFFRRKIRKLILYMRKHVFLRIFLETDALENKVQVRK